MSPDKLNYDRRCEEFMNIQVSEYNAPIIKRTKYFLIKIVSLRKIKHFQYSLCVEFFFYWKSHKIFKLTLKVNKRRRRKKRDSLLFKIELRGEKSQRVRRKRHMIIKKET